MSKTPRLVTALLLLAAGSGVLAQDTGSAPADVAGQEEPPTFGAGVDQVIVDAVVIDKEGDPVSGITGEDLIVLEDGVRQEIVSFEAVRLPDRPLAEPPPTPRVSTNAGSGAEAASTAGVDSSHIPGR